MDREGGAEPGLKQALSLSVFNCPYPI